MPAVSILCDTIMGVSTDGQLCYGIVFEEGHTFPWDAAPHDGNIESWWRAVKGYKPPFELYDAAGEYLGGVKPAESQIDAYFKHRREWLGSNPVPVQLVNYCSGDHPMWIIAVVGSCQRNSRGYPEKVDPSHLRVNDLEVQGLLDFCREHGIALPEGAEPSWWLSSYWG